jgi:hypothetical protein
MRRNNHIGNSNRSAGLEAACATATPITIDPMIAADVTTLGVTPARDNARIDGLSSF